MEDSRESLMERNNPKSRLLCRNWPCLDIFHPSILEEASKDASREPKLEIQSPIAGKLWWRGSPLNGARATSSPVWHFASWQDDSEWSTMPEFSKFSFESTTTACAPFCEENSIVKTVNDNIRVIRMVVHSIWKTWRYWAKVTSDSSFAATSIWHWLQSQQ